MTRSMTILLQYCGRACLLGFIGVGLAWGQEGPNDGDEFQVEIDAQFEELQLRLDEILGNQGGIVIEDLGMELPAAALGNFRSTGYPPPSHGEVKTDGDSEMLLQRAEEFAKQERYDLASTLWQKVIDQSADVLLEREEWKETTLGGHIYQRFRPMISEIESSMSDSFAKGLKSYRLQVDGEARATLAMAEPDEREKALSTVIQRYFLSGLGDDAAFELGCLKMERMEFLPAVRLFSKILDEYPNTDLNVEQVEIRLAGALARVGGIGQALEMVEALDQEHALLRPVLKLVREDIEQVRAGQGADSGLRENAALTTPPLVQPALADGLLPKTLITVWEQSYQLKMPETWPSLPESPSSPLPKMGRQVQRNNVFNRGVQQQQNKQPAKAKLLDRWLDQGFALSSGLVIRDGLAYFKTEDRLAVCNVATGELDWLGFRNTLLLDEGTRGRQRYFAGTAATAPVPATGEELLVFGDTLHQSMTLAGDTVYVLQGEPMDFRESDELDVEVVPNVRNRIRFNQFGSRMRGNRLVAYEAKTGRLKWYRRAMDDGNAQRRGLDFAPQIVESGFARAPLTYGSLLIAPVHEGSSLWLVGMDVETGDTLWRTFLCDEPAGQVLSTSVVSLSVDAGDAYVASGAGLAFSLDAISGALNWALKYPRTNIPPDNANFRRAYGTASSIDGWGQDIILTYGDKVIVAGSDFNHLFAVNRRSGKLVWEISKQLFKSEEEGRHLLGIYDGRLYVGTKRAIRCYQASGGKMLWETDTRQQCYGRAALTSSAVYVPQESSILQLDLKTGEIVATAAVQSSVDSEPVGNLYSDGQQLIVYGLKRIYALGQPQQEILP